MKGSVNYYHVVLLNIKPSKSRGKAPSSARLCRRTRPSADIPGAHQLRARRATLTCFSQSGGRPTWLSLLDFLQPRPAFQQEFPARQKQSPANLRGFAFSTSDGGDRGGPGPIRTRFMNSSRVSYRRSSMVSGRITDYPQVESRLRWSLAWRNKRQGKLPPCRSNPPLRV
jgi:hypothetical protein